MQSRVQVHLKVGKSRRPVQSRSLLRALCSQIVFDCLALKKELLDRSELADFYAARVVNKPVQVKHV